MQVA
jgi:flagellar basal body rod protein FlgF